MAPECSMTEPPQAFLTLLLSSPLTRAVEQIDPRLGPALLGELGHRIGERALEPHELGPIDRQLSRPDSFPGQVLYRVNGFGSAHQDLLGIAAPQRARSAEGT